MKHIIIRTAQLLALVSLASCDLDLQTGTDSPPAADTIYLNANIITINEDQPEAHALAVKSGFIIAVGDNDDVMSLQTKDTEIVDLQGKSVVPGFIDAHSHFSGVGMQAITANLLPAPDGPVNSIAELQRTMQEYIETSSIVKNYGVAIGFNYDDSQLAEHRHPTRHDLDAISQEIPIVIMHQSGHLGSYNSLALKMLNVDATTEDPPGGVIERETDGVTPSGVMQENAHFMLFHQMVPSFTGKDLVALYLAGEKSYLANGFTTVQEGKTDKATLDALPTVAATNVFNVDIISYVDIAAIGDAAILHGPLMSDVYHSRFRIGGVKLTFDGSPQGKTAWFTKPYLVPPQGQTSDYLGYPAFSDEEAANWMQLAYQNNWQLLVHTNGDAAIDQLINIAAELDAETANKDRRTVMIHGQYLREDQVSSLKELEIFPALYPMHTFYWGDWHRDSVAGPERADNISPTGWLRRAGMKFTIHSDSPVTYPDSMRIIDSAVNRRTRSNDILGADHRLTPMEALQAMTIWGAYQHFEEDIKGSLEVGKQADMVVLNMNPLTTPHRELKNIQVLRTINDGEVVWTHQ